MDKLPQLHCFVPGQGGIDNVARLVGVCTVAGGVCCAAVQFLIHKVADRLLVVADDQDSFAHLHALQHHVDHQGFNGKADERVKRGVQVKHKAGRHHHDQIGQKQRRRNAVQVGVFFHDQGNHIGAAAGSPHAEEQCRSNGRQRNGKNQFQHGLVRQRLVERAGLFQQHQFRRKHHGGITGGQGKLFAQKNQPQEQHQHIDHGGKLTGRNRGQLGNQCRRAGHTAKDKVVGKFEEIHPHRHHANAERDDRILPYYFHPFAFHGQFLSAGFPAPLLHRNYNTKSTVCHPLPCRA